jgi:hypothetical protein
MVKALRCPKGMRLLHVVLSFGIKLYLEGRGKGGKEERKEGMKETIQ